MRTPMPDRAVVDGDLKRWYEIQGAAMKDGMTQAAASDYADQCLVWINEAKMVHEQANHLRALVALSEDRQWLVVHTSGRAVGFDIYERWENADTFGYAPCNWVPDTGQDAHEVLAGWMAGR